MIFQFAAPYTSVSLELHILRNEITKLKNDLVTISKQMDGGDMTFDDIRMLLDLLKNRFVCLSLEVDTRMEGPLRLAMDRILTIATDDHEVPSSNTNFERLSATYHNTHSEPLLFPNTFFPVNPPPTVAVKNFRPFLPLHLNRQLYFKSQIQSRCGCLVLIVPDLRLRRRFILCCRDLWIINPNFFLKVDK